MNWETYNREGKFDDAIHEFSIRPFNGKNIKALSDPKAIRPHSHCSPSSALQNNYFVNEIIARVIA